MMFLKYLGSCGNEATLQKIVRKMGISRGAENECVTHACSAILKLHDEVVKCPNEAKR